MANITTDRNSLTHDDRLEAMAGVVREFKNVLALDENKAAAQRAVAEQQAFLSNPMGYSMGSKRSSAGTRGIVLGRRGRK